MSLITDLKMSSIGGDGGSPQDGVFLGRSAAQAILIASAWDFDLQDVLESKRM